MEHEKKVKKYEERSCGCVIFRRRDSQIEFLLIQQRQGHWTFPKGHQEENENCKETALREVREEVGIGVILIVGFECNEEYINPEKKTRKSVTYYVAEDSGEEVHIQKSEVLDYRWLSFDEANERIAFENTKEVLKKVNQFIIGQQCQQ